MEVISEIISMFMQFSIYGFEVFIWWRLTKSVLDLKYEKKYHTSAAIIFFLLMLLKHYLFLIPGIDQLQVIGTIFLLIYTFLVELFIFKNSFVEKLIWWGVFYLGLVIMELITIVFMSVVMNISIEELSMSQVSLEIIIIAKIITVLLFEGIIRNRKGKMVIGFTYFKELTLVIVFNIVLLLGAVFVFSNSNNISENIDNLIIFFFGTILFINAFTIALIFKIEKKSKEEIATKLKLQQIELELKLNDDMIGITDKLRKLRHDMNNHIGLIKTLVHTKKYDDLQEYIDQIYEDVEIANEIVLTENKTISVLLNAKKSKAKEKNIDFQSMIAAKEINMLSKDICALLGNILDNAIEAAEEANTKKYIQLTIQNTASGCIINCENSFGVKPMMRKGKLVTRKEDTYLHGIGTENIKDIVAKYKGEVAFDFDDESFHVRAVLPV